MNKKTTSIAIVVIILLLVGVVGFFFMNKSKSPTMTTSNEISQTQQAESMKKRSSLRDLMGLGQNLTCSYSDETGKSVGTMYMNGSNVRTDFDATMPEGNNVTSHMITDGATVYIWTDGQTIGFKQTLSDLEDNSDEDSKTQAENQTVNVDEQVDFDCNNWTVDRSKFDLPTGVEFSDFSSMMQDAMQNAGMTDDEDSATTPTDKCSVCESLSGDSKTQCLQALGC